MTRAQALLARALDIPDGKPIPAYVQGRATELEYYLQDCRLPADHPVVQAHVAGIVADWRVQAVTLSMVQAIKVLCTAIGQEPPSLPPGSPQGACPRTIWRILSMALTGRPNAETLPASILARATELERLLRDARLPADHPHVQAHAARIVADGRMLIATGLAQQAATVLRAWQAETKRCQASLDRRKQELEDREAELDQRQKALEAREADAYERARVLHAREAALALRESNDAEQPAQSYWKRLWTQFKAQFWSK